MSRAGEAAAPGVRRPGAPTGPQPSLFSVLLLSTALLLVGVVGAAFFGSGPWAWTVGLVYIAYDTWLLTHMVRASRRAIAAGAALLPAPAGPLPTMAVVIAARDERAALPAALDRLLAQDDQPEQILVVDDGSTDGTQEMLARRYGVRFAPGDALGRSAVAPRLRVLPKPGSGKARSLNLALEQIAEDLVVTLDADTLLEPGALAAVRRAFAAEPALWAACGVLTPSCTGAATAPVFQLYQTFEYLRGFLWRLAWMHDHTLVLVSGAFAAFRRAPLLEAGGFDPTSRVEDYELLFRLHRMAAEQQRPIAVRVIGEARASTDAPATLPMFFRQRRRWFAGFIETMFRHHAMVGSARYGRLGSFHLLVKTVDMLLPLYGLAAFAALLVFLALGKPIDPIILAALVGKFVFDLAMHASCVFLHQRWQERPVTARFVARSLLATFTEPFAFQIFRQLGALLGWVAFLRGRIDWAPQRLPAPAGEES